MDITIPEFTFNVPLQTILSVLVIVLWVLAFNFILGVIITGFIAWRLRDNPDYRSAFHDVLYETHTFKDMVEFAIGSIMIAELWFLHVYGWWQHLKNPKHINYLDDE
ncbi:hypothetical protein GR7B_00026 [Vibrio phage vB_VcorM_GR7B]|nr:hypothetical protein GR7B_00026 [Vibrio phage vB_VcorM_GR7B]